MIKSNLLTKTSEQEVKSKEVPLVTSKFQLFAQGVLISGVIAKLFQNSISIEIKIQEKIQVSQLDFTFDLCFQMLRPFTSQNSSFDQKNSKWSINDCYAIRFEKDENFMELRYPEKESDLSIWRAHLKKKLNQRGFHDQFLPIKKIGEGKFAQVYQVKNHEQEKLYAAKAFSKLLLFAEQHGKESIIKEINVMRTFDHQNLLKLEGVYETKNSIYLVVELLGNTLCSIIRSATFADRRRIIKDTLEGLAEMHKKGIMHRDLKPENILFRNNNSSFVIADFGLSQFVKEEKFMFLRCGTYGYVGPEILNFKNKDEKYDEKCDMFSLGIIFYILLFQKLPYGTAKNTQLLMKNKQCKIQIKDYEKRRFFKCQIDLLEKMLQKDPKLRISAEDAINHQYFSDEPEQFLLKKKIQGELKQIERQDEIKIKPKKKPKVVRKTKKNKQNQDQPFQDKNKEKDKAQQILQSHEVPLHFKLGENVFEITQDEKYFKGLDSPQAIMMYKNKPDAVITFENAEESWQKS